MPKLKVTLSIGISSCIQKDVLNIDQQEWDDCETDDQREELKEMYWKDWASNYINGHSEIIE